MGMAWFMIPASLVICTILLIQTERSQRGMLKMLSLPVNMAVLNLAKFTMLLCLLAVQMVLSVGAYYLSALAASKLQHYNLLLEPLYVIRTTAQIYAGAVPVAAVFWMLAVWIRTFIRRHRAYFHRAVGTDHSVQVFLFIPCELSVLPAYGCLWKSCKRYLSYNCQMAPFAACHHFNHACRTCLILPAVWRLRQERLIIVYQNLTSGFTLRYPALTITSSQQL